MPPIAIEAEAITANWPLTGVSVGAPVNSRWSDTRQILFITTDQGCFAAKAFRRHTRPVRKDGPDHSRVPRLDQLSYLEKRSYRNSPKVVLTNTGNATALTGDLVVGIFEFVPTGLKPHRRSRADTWRELGTAAAELNAHTDYPRPWSISIPRAMEEVAEHATSSQDFRDGVLALLARLEVLVDAPGSALVHGEINEANAGRRDDGSIVILDWDEAGTTAAALEYGYPLITQFLAENTGVPDLPTASAFYRGYRDRGGDVDRELLFAAALFHALRYMWFHNVGARWRRIVAAVENESTLVNFVLDGGIRT